MHSTCTLSVGIIDDVMDLSALSSLALSALVLSTVN